MRHDDCSKNLQPAFFYTENLNVTLLCFESFLNMNRCNIIQYVYDGK